MMPLKKGRPWPIFLDRIEDFASRGFEFTVIISDEGSGLE